MRPLFDPSRHEPMCEDLWNEAEARRTIIEIVDDILAAGGDGSWPGHPLDDNAKSRPLSLYLGGAGVLWALSWLVQRGAVPPDARIERWTAGLRAQHHAKPDVGALVPSWLCGVSGVDVLHLRQSWEAEVANELATGVDANLRNPTRELMWGSAGTLLAATFAHELSGEERWVDMARRTTDWLLASWEDRDGTYLWTQHLYEQRVRYLGAAHGFAGNVAAMLRAAPLLTESQRQTLVERASVTLFELAQVDDGAANWPAVHDRRPSVLQWCHGAPGIITCCEHLPPTPEVDPILEAGGKLIWEAGPLRKGPSLCHGTAGNGSAFLTLYRRTGRHRWLERARRFAMHAVRQVGEARSRYKQGRYSLWTGDAGTAVFLQQCVEGTSGMPTIDL